LRIPSFVAVPWNAFVAVFLYYVAVTVAVMGDVRFTDAGIVCTYGLPVLPYAAVIVMRFVSFLADASPGTRDADLPCPCPGLG
jgi:hypothetical protein